MQPADEVPAHYGVRAPTSRRSFGPRQRNGCLECLQLELDLSRFHSQKGTVDDGEVNPFFMGVAVGVILPQRLPYLSQGIVQIRPGVPLVALLPQKLGELSPRVSLPFGGKVAQERQ